MNESKHPLARKDNKMRGISSCLWIGNAILVAAGCSLAVADETAQAGRSGFSSLRLIYPGQMPRPVEIGLRQLFVDDYHIASVKGLRRMVNPVTKHPPLMEWEHPWEGLGPGMEYVHYDPEAKIYKAFLMYFAYTTKTGGTHYWTGYATSKDGWKWERPAVGLPIPRGSGNDGVNTDLRSLFSKKFEGPRILGGSAEFSDFEKTNIISMRTFAGYIVYDPHDPDPRKRYKSLQPFETGRFGDPLRLYYSPDGLHDWTPYEKNPLNVTVRDDTYHIFHDVRRKRYVLFDRSYAFGYRGGGRRVGYRASPDLKTYGPYMTVLAADAEDPHGTDIYGMTVFDYEGVYLGLVWVYNNHTKTRVVELAVSRDCVDWQRVDRTRPFIPRGPEGSPDSKLIFTAHSPPIIEGDQIRVFYTGQSGLHKPSTRAERTAYPMVGTLLLDRFVDVELDAGSSSGELCTHPLRVDDVEDKQLVLNVAGELSSTSRLRIEVVDADSGTAIPGYELDKCDPIEKNSLRHTVSWQGNDRLPSMLGGAVVLRFVLEAEAGSPKIYSFAFK